MPLNCDDWALIDVAGYQAQNNTWGKGDLTGWSQCIGLQAAEDGSIMARWTWDWLNSGGNVKAYPEISFGQKPGGPSTSPDLPLKVNQVGSAKVTYDVYSANDSGGNLAFDIWLTDTDNPDTFDSPPITHEIMVWLDSFGGLGPGGKFKERATIGGVEYNVFVAYNWGSGWTYVAFDRVKHQLGSGTLEMADFLEYMMANDLATGEEYMASIEFGNEVTHGTGETILNQYFISVQPK
jgi:cellulose 1,4-beta-cellobiosidase